ncbi:alginate export family protein [Variovorax sp. PAMC26660]|uniref:alginate export family protein n=1 Tax=Variovorax sp. PAMC26660 TaxID=2762322 RepID=UPI00164E99B2|nr:alginate export family protein [Variovorax sp. PAMC26660]QNK71155.1 alginate export family protein [Variovorax sp. PAMC26660]
MTTRWSRGAVISRISRYSEPRCRWRKAAWLALFGACASCEAADALETQGVEGTDPPVIGWQVRPSIELGGQVAGERRLFWNLSDVVAREAGFNNDRHWWEFYVKPSVALTYAWGGGKQFYSRLSAVGSGTARRDAFDAGNTGRLTLEEGVIGVRLPIGDGDTLLDLSAGPQTYSLGTGMLISNGGSNGFSRGALKLGPRKAFQNTAIARLSSGPWKAEAFYLDPNENPDSNSHTQLAGAALIYRPAPDRQIGLSYGGVTHSTAPYPQAALGGIGPPEIISDARNGLRFVYGFMRMPVLEGTVPQAWVGADLAREWNARYPMRAWGGRVEFGFGMPTLPGTPKVTLGYQSFSGDNPTTGRQERFDPLYYEGSPGDWATGSKSSMVFINTNVNALQAAIEFQLSKQDVLTVYLAHVRANRLGSPLQFGQATRVVSVAGAPAVISGVTNAHLSNDLFFKYTRAINRHTYLTAGYSASFPGAGIDSLVGRKAPTWTGWFANMVLVY